MIKNFKLTTNVYGVKMYANTFITRLQKLLAYKKEDNKVKNILLIEDDFALSNGVKFALQNS